MKKVIVKIVSAIMAVSVIGMAPVNAKAEASDKEVTTMEELVSALKQENHFESVTYVGYDELRIRYTWDIDSRTKWVEWINTLPEEAIGELEHRAERRGFTLEEVLDYYTEWHYNAEMSYKVFTTLVMT